MCNKGLLIIILVFVLGALSVLLVHEQTDFSQANNEYKTDDVAHNGNDVSS